MNEEHLKRSLEFILRMQVEFTAQQAILTEKHKEFEAADKMLQTKLDRRWLPRLSQFE
jgi:hypothetical protein